jgi:hypothetical protein
VIKEKDKLEVVNEEQGKKIEVLEKDSSELHKKRKEMESMLVES